MDAQIPAAPADELILVPVREAVLFPGMVVPLSADRAPAAAALQDATRLRGAVRIVPPDTLPNDGVVIQDDRPVP